MVTFLQRSELLEEKYTQKMRDGMLAGHGLANILSELRFSDAVVTQIALSEIHGDTRRSLQRIESYLDSLSQVKRRVIEVATYPFLLLSFLILIMLGLKNYLLPQLSQGRSFATDMIQNLPTFFFVSLMLLGCFILVTYFWFKKRNPLVVYRRLAQIPYIGGFVRLYLSAYYAREWGNLIGQGLELSTIVTIMQDQKSRLFVAIGRDLEEALLSGQSFSDKVSTYPFFKKELGLMIEYGEVKAKLGSELSIYAQESWEMFFARITKATQFIQPAIFILVALIIVLIYAAMLLPMYQNMEVPL